MECYQTQIIQLIKDINQKIDNIIISKNNSKADDEKELY